jgi:hypothetical protein
MFHTQELVGGCCRQKIARGSGRSRSQRSSAGFGAKSDVSESVSDVRDRYCQLLSNVI